MLLLLDRDAFDEDELVESDEVIQPSSLRDYRWPEIDPSTVPQRVRVRGESDVELVQAASTASTLDLEALTKNTRGMSVAQKVHFILTHQRFQINPVADLRKEEIWLTRIGRYVDRGDPILITYPLMCKIGSWAKQMSNVGPTAGEEATIFFFRHIDSLVRTVYEPGLRIMIVSDAALYNSAFCNPQVEVQTYMDCVRDLIHQYGDGIMEFHDYVELLSEYSVDYSNIHARYQRLMCEDPKGVLDDIRFRTLFESVKASINVRKFGMTYDDMRELFSADANDQNRHWDVVDTMTRLAMEELVSIRKACMELNLFERRWPEHVRVSCHKDRKGGRWVIGLKPYPEYYGSSKLLPYHGVPLIRVDKGGRPKMDIVPEVMLRGRKEAVRVENLDGEVYFYDATDSDASGLTGYVHPGFAA